MVLFGLILVGFSILGCLALLRITLRVVIVRGESMMPALAANDRVLVWRFWPTRWLHHEQIVVVCPWGVPGDGLSLFIKRIVGLPGETLITSIDELPEHLRLLHAPFYDAQGQRRWHIPSGHFFVRGDNRQGSIDSTYWGAIHAQRVYGLVWRRLSYMPRLRQSENVQGGTKS